MKITPMSSVLIVLLLAACNRAELTPTPGVQPVKMLVVADSNLYGARYFPARFNAGDETQLAFQRAGYLQQLLVREGERVKKGQLLAALDGTDLALRVRDREASYRLANTQYQRYAALYRQRVASRSELDIQRAQLDSAQAELNIAREDLNMTRIVAPFDGVIANVNVRNYQTVNPAQPIATLSSLETFDVVFSLPESWFSAIDVNARQYQPWVRFTALPGREFPAVYKEHATVTSGDSQTYQVTLSLPRPTELPGVSGMSGSVRINFDQLAGTTAQMIVVPDEALVGAGKAPGAAASVWVVEGQGNDLRVASRAVQLGEKTQAGIEVIQGLRDGDRIVAAGAGELHEHQAVRAWVRERGL